VLNGDGYYWSGAFPAMDWDDATGQAYRMVSGYFLGPGVDGRGIYGPPSRPTVDLLTDIAFYGQNSRITGALRAAFRADLRYWDTAIIVLTPQAPRHDQLLRALDQLTGQPARPVPGALLWDVRALSG